MRKINQAGLELIKSFESLYLHSYQCPSGIWTIGWGHTKGVKPGQCITRAQAEAFLRADLVRAEWAVERLVKVPLTDNQFSALVSFVFNCGEAALRTSTLLRKLNRRDYAGAADQFRRWVKSKGKVLTGLVRRREAERSLFLAPEEVG